MKLRSEEFEKLISERWGEETTFRDWEEDRKGVCGEKERVEFNNRERVKETTWVGMKQYHRKINPFFKIGKTFFMKISFKLSSDTE